MSMGRRDWTVAKETRVQVIEIISVKKEKGLRYAVSALHIESAHVVTSLAMGTTREESQMTDDIQVAHWHICLGLEFLY